MFARKGSDRQRHLVFHTLATIGTRLGGMRWINGVEVFAVSFSNPLQPLKEHAPSDIVDRLAHVVAFHHAFDVQILNDNGIIAFVVIQPVNRLCYEVKALAGNLIVLLCEGVSRFPIAFTVFLLPRQLTLQLGKFLFASFIETAVANLFAVRGDNKLFCPNVHTTSRFRDTRHRIRDFANDKAIPATCRLF